MGVPVYEDLYALSQMVQWIWRSRIGAANRPRLRSIGAHAGAAQAMAATGSTIELVNETDPGNRFFTQMILPEREPVAA